MKTGTLQREQGFPVMKTGFSLWELVPCELYSGFAVVMATGLSRPGKSREGPGTGQDRTGPRDLEGPVVLWSRD